MKLDKMRNMGGIQKNMGKNMGFMGNLGIMVSMDTLTISSCHKSVPSWHIFLKISHQNHIYLNASKIS